VKTASSSDVADNLFVVIAATYDLSAPESPVAFRTIEHIKPDISEMEARELFQMHAEQWNFEGWGVFLDILLRVSKNLYRGRILPYWSNDGRNTCIEREAEGSGTDGFQ